MGDLCKVVCDATHLDCISCEPLLISLLVKDCENTLQGPIQSCPLPHGQAQLYGAPVKNAIAPWTKKCAKKEDYWICSFWALWPCTTYVLKVARATGGEETSMTVQTEELPTVYRMMFSSNAAAHTLPNTQLVARPDFARCQMAQGSSSYMLMIAPEPLNFFSVTALLPLLFYQGLFALPDSAEVSDGQHLWYFLLPNPPQRCVLDLQDAALDQKGAAPPSCTYPWRRSRKVKRLLASGRYACVVRDTPAARQTSLRRAAAYHEDVNESTWLSEELITALADLPPLRDVGGAAGPPTGSALKVLVVEMVERASGKVVAGCCGFALGSVYHDFTMYTLDRTSATLGTVLTKLLGEALQRCGYNLWYWGILMDYMEQFRAAYGLKELSRLAFHERWGKYRDEPPRECVDTFLKNGHGMLPYFSEN